MNFFQVLKWHKEIVAHSSVWDATGQKSDLLMKTSPLEYVTLGSILVTVQKEAFLEWRSFHAKVNF